MKGKPRRFHRIPHWSLFNLPMIRREVCSARRRDREEIATPRSKVSSAGLRIRLDADSRFRLSRPQERDRDRQHQRHKFDGKQQRLAERHDRHQRHLRRRANAARYDAGGHRPESRCDRNGRWRPYAAPPGAKYNGRRRADDAGSGRHPGHQQQERRTEELARSSDCPQGAFSSSGCRRFAVYNSPPRSRRP